MDRIMALRDQAMAAGLKNTTGARHVEAFSELVEHSGRLDELRIIPKTFGMANLPALMNVAPEGIRAFTHGKLPPLIHKKIDNVKAVREIFKKIEEAEVQ